MQMGSPVLTHFTHEGLVRRHELPIVDSSQGKIHTIIGRMVKLDCNPRRRLEQRARRKELDIGSFEKSGGKKGILLGKLAPADLLP